MKTIALTQGMVALVDDDVYETLNGRKWYAYRNRSAFYTRHNVKLMPAGEARALGVSRRRHESMHRLIMGAAPDQMVDHINGDGLDNRRANLRICSNAENLRNKRIYRNNKTGYKGVYWRADLKKFRASIRLCGKMIYLGYFLDPVEAGRVYDAAAMKYHGEFARLNFPKGVAA